MNWYGVTKFDHRVVALYSRHYSSVKGGKSVRDWLEHGITPPGESITLLTPEGGALFVWLKQNARDDGQTGVNCAVFRNEVPDRYLSSALILEAEQLAWDKWPGERLFTYVDPKSVKGDGACFKRAGWKKMKTRSKGGLIILEKLPELATNGAGAGLLAIAAAGRF